MRLFIAIPLPPAVADAAARALPPHPALRAVRPELLHITLAFLGAVDTDRAEDVADAARDAARRSAPFGIALDGLGRYPAAGIPRVVWLGIGPGGGELERLAASTRDALAARHLPFDPKPFRPHVTLARVRDAAERDEARAAGAAVEGARVAALGFDADAVVVFESVLSPKGPRYTARATVPLGVGGKS